MVLELTLDLWYLSVAAVLNNSKPVGMLAIKYAIESLPVS